MTAPEQWSASVRALHWLGALAVIFLLALGVYMTKADLDAARAFDLYQLHKTLGWLTLPLTLVRLAVRASTAAPAPLPTLSARTRFLARIAHFALYALAFFVALSGWIRVSSAIIPIPIDLFGFGSVPDIAPVNAGLSESMARAHSLAAYALAALVAIHAAAALKHHLVDRDATLRRMMGGWATRDNY